MEMFEDGLAVPYHYRRFGQLAATAFIGKHGRSPECLINPGRAQIEMLDECYYGRSRPRPLPWLKKFFEFRLTLDQRSAFTQTNIGGFDAASRVRKFMKVDVYDQQGARVLNRQTQTSLLGIAARRTKKQEEKLRERLARRGSHVQIDRGRGRKAGHSSNDTKSTNSTAINDGIDDDVIDISADTIAADSAAT